MTGVTRSRRYIKWGEFPKEHRERLILVGNGARTSGRLVASSYGCGDGKPITRQQLRYELQQRLRSRLETPATEEHLRALVSYLDHMDKTEVERAALVRAILRASAVMTYNQVQEVLNKTWAEKLK